MTTPIWVRERSPKMFRDYETLISRWRHDGLGRGNKYLCQQWSRFSSRKKGLYAWELTSAKYGAYFSRHKLFVSTIPTLICSSFSRRRPPSCIQWHYGLCRKQWSKWFIMVWAISPYLLQNVQWLIKQRRYEAFSSNCTICLPCCEHFLCHASITLNKE